MKRVINNKASKYLFRTNYCSHLFTQNHLLMNNLHQRYQRQTLCHRSYHQCPSRFDHLSPWASLSTSPVLKQASHHFDILERGSTAPSIFNLCTRHEWSASRPGHFTSGTHYIASW